MNPKPVLADNPVLCCDVDGTIYSPYEVATAEIARLTGKDVKPEDWTHYYYLHDLVGKEAVDAAFEFACSQDEENLWKREFYPNCKEILRFLQDLGVHVAFVTHAACAQEKREFITPWLKHHFPDASVHCVGVERPKLRKIKALGAVGIVDDRPRTLKEVADAGLFAATLLQPWTRDFVASRDDVFGFEDWNHLLDYDSPLWEALGAPLLGEGKVVTSSWPYAV